MRSADPHATVDAPETLQGTLSWYTRSTVENEDNQEVRMGLFEQQPWLLVPIIIVTVEAWFALKAAAGDMIRRWAAARHSRT